MTSTMTSQAAAAAVERWAISVEHRGGRSVVYAYRVDDAAPVVRGAWRPRRSSYWAQEPVVKARVEAEAATRGAAVAWEALYLDPAESIRRALATA